MKSPVRRSPLVVPLGQAGAAAEGRDARDLLGPKGAELDRLAADGYPTPPGFALTLDGCARLEGAAAWPEDLAAEWRDQLAALERRTGRRLGDPRHPLLLAVRGAGVAILNVGLNDKTVLGLAAHTGRDAAAWHCYRMFLEQFGAVALGVEAPAFAGERDRVRRKYKARSDAELRPDQVQEIVEAYQKALLSRARAPMAYDSHEQLRRAASAVARAGGARLQPVQVQAMVLGNLDPDSGCGVAFSRDPVTGVDAIAGSYQTGKQGPELDTPAAARVDAMAREKLAVWREVHGRLVEALRRLEHDRRHPQEIAFAVERGELWLLRARAAQRSAAAGLRWAVEWASPSSGKARWTTRQALATLTAADLREALGGHPASGSPPRRGRRRASVAGHPQMRALRQVLDWADALGDIEVFAVADRPEEAVVARSLGATGIGGWPCTGWLSDGDGLWALRAAMLEPSPPQRALHLAPLLPSLRRAYETLFTSFGAAPVHLRLPDYDWGALAPKSDREWREAARRLDQPVPRLQAAMGSWASLRGARGLLALPELVELAVHAGLEAAAAVESGKAVRPRPAWWLPGVNGPVEAHRLFVLVREALAQRSKGMKTRTTWETGWILQSPRAALLADQFTGEGQWFAFDLPSLQRGMLGLDRGDLDPSSPDPWRDWLETGRSFDMAGLGFLLQSGIRQARLSRPDARFGAIGVQADDVAQFRALARIGCDFACVRASEGPIARLSSAQATQPIHS